ncbi:MAG TPA: DUF4214 domain-containing protein, partial [Burkholderiaceae bacterium]
MKIRDMVIALAVLLSACGGQTDSSTRATDKHKLSVARVQTSVKQQLLASDYEYTVQALYVAYFGRPADPAGLTNFENALLALGAPTDVIGLANAYSTNPAIAALIDAFGNSAESKALYGAGDSKSFVTAVFNNVLGRPPQTEAGLDFWASAIDNGSLSKGNAALSIMAGAFANTSNQGRADAFGINLRLAIAGYFTTCVTNENAQSAYVGTAAAAAARADLASITTNHGDNYYEPVEKAVTALFPSSASYLELIVGAQGAMGNEPAGLASLNYPQGVAADSYGNLYIADTNSNSIRMVTSAGAVTTFAGVVNCGNGAQVSGPTTICQPTAVAIDSQRNVYTNNGPTILKVSQSGTVTVFAGQYGVEGFADGTGVQAKFVNPVAIAIDASDTLYVADSGNSTIRKITPGGVVTTLAGNAKVTGSTNGYSANASFANPGGIAVGNDGTVYVADTNNSLIRAITPTGLVSTLAGSLGPSGHKDGQGTGASFSY